MTIIVRAGGNVHYIQALCTVCDASVDMKDIIWYNGELTVRCVLHKFEWERQLAPA